MFAAVIVNMTQYVDKYAIFRYNIKRKQDIPEEEKKTHAENRAANAGEIYNEDEKRLTILMSVIFALMYFTACDRIEITTSCLSDNVQMEKDETV